jgi:hypothetical protein
MERGTFIRLDPRVSISGLDSLVSQARVDTGVSRHFVRTSKPIVVRQDSVCNAP